MKNKRKKKRKLNVWQKHVQATSKKNPKMKFGDVLKTAKKTYKKK